jgi:hypothetical protein
MKVNRRFGGTSSGPMNKPRKKPAWNKILMLVSCLAYTSSLKIEATHSSKTSVDFWRNKWSYISEDRTLYNHRYENLKSYTLFAWIFYDLLNTEFNHCRIRHGIKGVYSEDRGSRFLRNIGNHLVRGYTVWKPRRSQYKFPLLLREVFQQQVSWVETFHCQKIRKTLIQNMGQFHVGQIQASRMRHAKHRDAACEVCN